MCMYMNVCKIYVCLKVRCVYIICKCVCMSVNMYNVDMMHVGCKYDAHMMYVCM